jgi:hypothetical protein
MTTSIVSFEVLFSQKNIIVLECEEMCTKGSTNWMSFDRVVAALCVVNVDHALLLIDTPRCACGGETHLVTYHYESILPKHIKLILTEPAYVPPPVMVESGTNTRPDV